MLLQLFDPPQAPQVALSVPGHAAFATRRVEQAFALVEADGVDGDPRRPSQLFDAVLHEWILAQSYGMHQIEPATRLRVQNGSA